MHKRLAIFVAVALLLLLGGTTSAEQGPQPRNAATRKDASASTPEQGDTSLQRQRLEFDKQKLASDTDIENRKLKIEREKLEAEESILSHASAMAPWIVAFGTLISSILSFRKQAELQFEIKAAEIAFSARAAECRKSQGQGPKVDFPQTSSQGLHKRFRPKGLR
jgi:hypothetical protein